MVPSLENGLVKQHLRPKERLPEGRSEELVYQETVLKNDALKNSFRKKALRVVAPTKKGMSPAVNPVRFKYVSSTRPALPYLWLHLPRTRGVVMTTSVLLGWCIVSIL